MIKRILKYVDTKQMVLLVFFSAIQVFGMLAMPTLTANIIDYGVTQGDLNYIYQQAIIMLVIAVITVVGSITAVYIAASQSQGLGEQLRNQLFDKVVNFTSEEIDKFGSSTLITRSTNDIMQVQFVSMMASRMLIVQPIMIAGAALVAIFREPQLSFVFLITIPILAILVWLLLRSVNPLFRSLQRKTDVLNRVFREGLTGVRVIRAFRKNDYEVERFDEANQDFMNTSIKAQIIMAALMPVMILVISGTNMLIIWFGGQFISTGDVQVGNLVAFLTYASLILVGIMMLSMVLAFLPRGQVAVERAFEVLDTKNTIKDPENPVAVNKDDKVSLEFDHVDFRYPGAEKLALGDINFSVKEGETLAIIGGTGAGKSSLANLLLRLYDIESGSIKINEQDIRNVSQKNLREMIGFATQNASLFEGTIRENIEYGKKDATDEEIWHALDVAQGKDFVENLDKQLDARVEHAGGNFSGGQQQRLSIARALVTEANILVFDDSFSALDFKTDARLREALKPETEDAAVIIIAQRISTVVDADTILVLNQGQLVGKGTHEELKENNKVYQEIIESQLKGEDI